MCNGCFEMFTRRVHRSLYARQKGMVTGSIQVYSPSGFTRAGMRYRRKNCLRR